MGALQHILNAIHLNKEKKMNSHGLNASHLYLQNELEKEEEDKTNIIIPLGSRGGALLNMIQTHIDTSGEKHVRILYNKLMKAACCPYFRMLSNWIYDGVISDVYGEFMIQEKTHLKKEDVSQQYNNEYWTGRYSLNIGQIPLILYDYKDIIVTTGKYLNVMRESKYRTNSSEKVLLHECNARE